MPQSKVNFPLELWVKIAAKLDRASNVERLARAGKLRAAIEGRYFRYGLQFLRKPKTQFEATTTQELVKKIQKNRNRIQKSGLVTVFTPKKLMELKIDWNYLRISVRWYSKQTATLQDWETSARILNAVLDTFSNEIRFGTLVVVDGWFVPEGGPAWLPAFGNYIIKKYGGY